MTAHPVTAQPGAGPAGAQERAASPSREAGSCCRHRERWPGQVSRNCQGQGRVLPSPTDGEIWGQASPVFPSTPLLGSLTLVWNSPISSHPTHRPLHASLLSKDPQASKPLSSQHTSELDRAGLILCQRQGHCGSGSQGSLPTQHVS